MPIRTATAVDMQAIADIYAHHVRHSAASFEIDPPDCAEIERRWQAVLSQDLPYLVSEVKGSVAGYAYAVRYRPRAAYRFTVEDSVYIHPDFLKRGLGQSLLAELINQCKESGIRQMIAVIGDSGNTGSIRLHEKLGFRKVGVFEAVGRKFGRWIDTVLMQRGLYSDDRIPELRQIAEQGRSRPDVLELVAEFLRRSGNYRWVGLYAVDHNAREVRNLVFSGPGAPVYPVFPIEKGLTGRAVREKRTVNVSDVTADPSYLTAFGTTRSEIIVPVFDLSRNLVVGTIDVENERPDAFSDREQVFLEDCARAIQDLWRFD